MDHGLCEANGVCAGVAPEVFALDEDDRLQVLQEFPPAELLGRVREAVQGCPKGALGLRPGTEAGPQPT
ncbi:ferredoxin [Trujillonella endophytica]|uniref:Ferredoxin n=1 Tax=Trujillonella endophytica TaxID=673521 RepID=A0A1H8T6F4_9ACTN|nr:ferredoxin [Trujillella endophytica]